MNKRRSNHKRLRIRVPFKEGDVGRYLTYCIGYWTGIYAEADTDEGQLIADCYLDAYKTVEQALFGENKLDNSSCPALSHSVVEEIQDIETRRFMTVLHGGEVAPPKIKGGVRFFTDVRTAHEQGLLDSDGRLTEEGRKAGFPDPRGAKNETDKGTD